MIQKHVLVPQRLRRPPATGWSWLDRRFLREHGDYLSREAVLLYLFLAAVADRHGLSFYSDTTLACRLRLSQAVLVQAREELLNRDLIAHELHVVARERTGPHAVVAQQPLRGRRIFRHDVFDQLGTGGELLFQILREHLAHDVIEEAHRSGAHVPVLVDRDAG